MEASVTEREHRASVRVPPYIAFRTFKTFIEDLKVNGVPTRIDRSVWGARFSGSVGAQLMSALRFLSLLDGEDRPEPALKALVEAHGADGWASALRTILQKSYEPIMALKLKEITAQELGDQFKANYKAQEEVLRKSITFFLQAAQESEVEISRRILKGTRRVARPRSTRPARKRQEAPVQGDVPAPKLESPLATRHASAATPNGRPYQTLIDILDPERMGEEEMEAVWTLIRYLKKEGKS